MKIHFKSAFYGFTLGSIIMAYIADYNRSQLPLAICLYIISVICWVITDHMENK